MTAFLSWPFAHWKLWRYTASSKTQRFHQICMNITTSLQSHWQGNRFHTAWMFESMIICPHQKKACCVYHYITWVCFFSACWIIIIDNNDNNSNNNNNTIIIISSIIIHEYSNKYIHNKYAYIYNICNACKTYMFRTLSSKWSAGFVSFRTSSLQNWSQPINLGVVDLFEQKKGGSLK
jgi:hypothetical protein